MVQADGRWLSKPSHLQEQSSVSSLPIASCFAFFLSSGWNYVLFLLDHARYLLKTKEETKGKILLYRLKENKEKDEEEDDFDAIGFYLMKNRANGSVLLSFYCFFFVYFFFFFSFLHLRIRFLLCLFTSAV
jgi:hypothetical protein